MGAHFFSGIDERQLTLDAGTIGFGCRGVTRQEEERNGEKTIQFGQNARHFAFFEGRRCHQYLRPFFVDYPGGALMPRDDWKRARDKDVARRLANQNTSRKKSKRTRAIRRKQNVVTKSRLQTPSTILWFGKYKKLTLQEVFQKDPSYLNWLAGLTPSDSNWRIKLLVDYLRTSPNLAKRRTARHTGGDEAPVITKMAYEIRQTRPNTSRTDNSCQCEATVGRDFDSQPTMTSGRIVENSPG